MSCDIKPKGLTPFSFNSMENIAIDSMTAPTGAVR